MLKTMEKSENKKFIADAFVSRKYRSAIILEDYLVEIDDVSTTRYAIKTLQRFNKQFKDLKTLKNKEYITNLVIKEFEKKFKKDEWVPEFVRTLLMNIIKTKYKVEILENKKMGNSYNG